MEWTVVLAGPARKSLKRIPAGDKTRILAALAEMQQNPFQGDIRKLQGLPWLPAPRGRLAHPVRGRARTQACRHCGD
jgi:mRNA-degrading endonuclease RelE of RelBE toxin-antitoxin system